MSIPESDKRISFVIKSPDFFPEVPFASFKTILPFKKYVCGYFNFSLIRSLIFLTKLGLGKREIVIQKIRQFKNLLRTRIDQSDLEAFHRVSLQVNEIIEQGDIFKT